jgi:hypothetical protein
LPAGEIPVALRAPSISPALLNPDSKEDISNLVKTGHF